MARRISDKAFRVIGFLSLCALGVGAGILWLLQQPCPPPDRPRGVPPGSRWVGDCDGGSWFELMGAVEPGRYQLRMYHHPSGEVSEEGWYDFATECPGKPPAREEILDQIMAFDGNRVTLFPVKQGMKHCVLARATSK